MTCNTRSNAAELRILVVEDSDADAALLEEAFAMVEADVDLIVATDGRTALSVLRGDGQYAGAPRPDIVILDLGLPGMSGQEVLEAVKTNPDLRRIPVIVLTDADDDRVVSEVYEKHANAFVTKCGELDDMLELADYVSGFWGRVVTLPSPKSAR